ncbi:MAG: 23S rRNA (adenine(2503)-C(2))-methyltransferase RlmN [Anaerolineales bacterium]
MSSPTTGRLNLLDLSLDELAALLVSWGQPRFRAVQLWHWLYRSLAVSFDEMSNIPAALRAQLAQQTTTGRLPVVSQSTAEDGQTEKALFRTTDGHHIETVLMRYAKRNTVCVSTQIGCALGCVFCVTGQSGFTRDLSAGEISAQVLHYAQTLGSGGAHLTNVVLMGMGEPMLNADAVWRSIANLNEPEGLAMGARRFTISTAGIVPGIERMAREGMEVGLAVSLHAPDDELRNRLVPINRRYPIARLLEACRHYIERTGRRVTFEYILMDGINDSDAQARRTAELLQGLLCHVNLIPLNPSPACPYAPSPRERILRFRDILVEAHIQATIRLRRGIDIEAGCGQLRERYEQGQAQAASDG